jgi:hypothetical protein
MSWAGKIRRGAAWLGVLALAVQLYLPLHFVGRAAAASAALPQAAAHHHAAAAATHHGDSERPPEADQTHCPICSMLHVAAVAVLAAGPNISSPDVAAAGTFVAALDRGVVPPTPAAYAARAPPSSIDC